MSFSRKRTFFKKVVLEQLDFHAGYLNLTLHTNTYKSIQRDPTPKC